MPTNTETLRYAIALCRIKGIGDVLARKLIENFGSPEAIFREKPETLALIPRIGTQLALGVTDRSLLEIADKEIAFISQNGIDSFYFEDEEYPEQLRDCTDAPLLLFYKGETELKGKRFVSMVGTRSCTQYGIDLIENFLQEMAALAPEVVIVSGLAYGIDVNAHKSALKNGLSTIGVLAHGLDRIYPYVHRQIAKQMLEQGGLLTEYLSETNPDRGNFLARNRIIAGLSDATIVVESADKGGSIVTANIANTYGRDVFAFPGRTSDRYSEGCNRLIRQNRAALITGASDFLELMNWLPDSPGEQEIQMEIPFDLSSEEQQIVELLTRYGEMHLNRLVVETEIPISELTGILMELEFRNMVRPYPGGMYRLK